MFINRESLLYSAEEIFDAVEGALKRGTPGLPDEQLATKGDLVVDWIAQVELSTVLILRLMEGGVLLTIEEGDKAPRFMMATAPAKVS